MVFQTFWKICPLMCDINHADPAFRKFAEENIMVLMPEEEYALRLFMIDGAP